MAAARSARDLAVLARGTDVVKAMGFYRRAVKLDPENAQTWLEYGDTALDAGHTGVAMRAFESAVAHAKPTMPSCYASRRTIGLATSQWIAEI
jgi:predicted TPR repeat methyltransferase